MARHGTVSAVVVDSDVCAGGELCGASVVALKLFPTIKNYDTMQTAIAHLEQRERTEEKGFGSSGK